MKQSLQSLQDDTVKRNIIFNGRNPPPTFRMRNLPKHQTPGKQEEIDSIRVLHLRRSQSYTLINADDAQKVETRSRNKISISALQWFPQSTISFSKCTGYVTAIIDTYIRQRLSNFFCAHHFYIALISLCHAFLCMYDNRIYQDFVVIIEV